MNTPAHLLLGVVAFGRPHERAITTAAFLGALVPDLSLYLLASWHLFVLKTPPGVVFDDYYFSPQWQQIFAIDNSFLIWGTVLGLALWLRKRWLVAFAGAGLLHLLFDFLLHHDDARRHFWPASDWVFHSPFSYWDPNHHGAVIGGLEFAASLVMCALLWHRFHGRFARLLLLLCVLALVLPFVMWAYLFATA